jgi:sulfonate transport system ATP-binding protein
MEPRGGTKIVSAHEPILRAENLSKTYDTANGRVEALKNVSLDLNEGSFMALLGKSGCGKTTLLRLFAGLEQPTEGSVAVGVPMHQVGYVFQEPRLMPWLSVEQNIRFAEKASSEKSRAFGDADRILDILKLKEFANLLPHELSGGMAQRAALGRTLFSKPSIILMDEPFGSLDWFTRKALQDDLSRLWKEGGKTILFVTHDIDEAMLLAQEIVVLRNGAVSGRFGVGEEPGDGGHRRAQLRERILGTIEGVASI